MRPKIRKILHNCWYRACLVSVSNENSTSTSLLRDFYIILRNEVMLLQKNNATTTEETCMLNLFLQGVKICTESRMITSFIADKYLKELIHTGILIQQWQSEVKNIPSHVKIILRRKGIESDLTKILYKALQNEDPEVKDRYGFTFITYDEDIQKLYEFTEKFTGIVTGIFYDMQSEFHSWVIANPNLYEKDKTQVQKVLQSNLRLRNRGALHDQSEGFDHEKYPDIIVPKKVNFFFNYGFKDYVSNPKSNSYQALQCVLELSMPIWDILEEIIRDEILDAYNSQKYFNDMIISIFKEFLPELSNESLNQISRLLPAIISSFPIEGHFKTKKMSENPNATHESHKSKIFKLRKIFTLTQSELKAIKAKAKEYGTSFEYYDSALKDSWGLHHAVFFSPEECIFYAK